jgi:hypothetical protein
MSCTNMIEQVVPRGYDYRVITQKCGTTSIHGEPQYCDECERAHRKQGHRPNECEHGYNIWDEHCPHPECN